MLGLGLPTETEPKQVPERLKTRVRLLCFQVSHITIYSIFGGQVVSLVEFQSCKTRTHRMEPFLDLSLPVAKHKLTQPKMSEENPASEEASGDPVWERPDQGHLDRQTDAASVTKGDRGDERNRGMNLGLEAGEQPKANVSSDPPPVLVKLDTSNGDDTTESGAPAVAFRERLRSQKNRSRTADEEWQPTLAVMTSPANVYRRAVTNYNDLPATDGTCSWIEHPRDGETREAETPDAAEFSPADPDGNCTARADAHGVATSGTRSPAAQQPTQSEWLSRALTRLAPSYQPAAGECSPLSCLSQFTAPELLSGTNAVRCNRCTELQSRLPPSAEKGSQRHTVCSEARRQLLIYSAPPVLTVHLKRFEVSSAGLRKANRHVQFAERLDLAPFCSATSQNLPQMKPGQRCLPYSL